MAEPIVNVKQGRLRGAEVKSPVGGSFLSFKGVPFAKPPVGDLRFKDPQPPQAWTGVRDALNEGPQCVQQDECTREIEGDDDCLYLNVATPSVQGSRPVMVWIHGGGFIWGDGGSNLYGPDYLVKMNVVFVGINYRLGVFGFLNLEHEAAPGNMGLKDQVAALKWVQENIAEFGGDPNNVTIFGQSAGGASVHYHLLSPLSKGLFHKAIAQSGVAFNSWASVSKTVEIAHRLVSYLGKEMIDPNEIVEYLRTVPALELANAQQNISTPEEKAQHLAPFGASVDSKSTNPFLPRPARELAVNCHDVPLMLGYTSHEGVECTLGLSDEAYAKGYQYFEAMMLPNLPELPSSKVPDAFKEIRKFYFGDKQFTEDVVDEYIQCSGDSQIVFGIHEVAEIRAKTESPTYLYRFSHNAPKKLSTTNFCEKDVEGSAHGDELVYLFYPTYFSNVRFIEPGSKEQVVSEILLRMWTDFARTGNPTPQIDELITVKWEPVTSTAKNYLEIGAELSAGVDPNEEIVRFWKRIRAMADDQ